jgi:hypothetical protein
MRFLPKGRQRYANNKKQLRTKTKAKEEKIATEKIDPSISDSNRS